MGVSWYTCCECDETFNDCGNYHWCQRCGAQFCGDCDPHIADETDPCPHCPENTIVHNFSYHAPKEGQPKRYEKIRGKAKELALLIHEECPESRERSLAMSELETAVFWANAAIARNE